MQLQLLMIGTPPLALSGTIEPKTAVLEVVPLSESSDRGGMLQGTMSSGKGDRVTLETPTVSGCCCHGGVVTLQSGRGGGSAGSV